MKTCLCAIALVASGFAHGAPVWPTGNDAFHRLATVAPPSTAARSGTVAAVPTTHFRRVESAHAAPGPDNTCDPDGLCLAVTVGLDTAADACADTTTLIAAQDDRVNVCYTVTNQSTTTTFQYHTAADDSIAPDQQFFISEPISLAPGETYRYNRIQALDGSLYAQTTWSATAELPTYSYDDTQPADFVDISESGTRLDVEPGAFAPVVLPFPVSVYGSPSRHLAVDTRGAIEFGTDYSPLNGFDPSTLRIPWAIAFTNGYAAEVAPYRMLLGYGRIFTDTQGVAPNRRFIVQWDQMKPATVGFSALVPIDTPQTITFEVVFGENSADILYQYRTTAFGDPTYDDGATATVGINYGVLADQTGVATAYSQATPSLHDGLAIRWTPSAVATSQSSAFASVQVETPIVGVAPTELDLSAPSAGTATGTIDIVNQGIGRVDYRFAAESAPVDAAIPAFGLLSTGDFNTFLATGLSVAWFDAGSPSPPPMVLSPSLFTTSANADFDLNAVAFVGDDFKTLYQVGENLTRIDLDGGTQTVVGPTGLFERGRHPAQAAYDTSTRTLFVLATNSLQPFGFTSSELYSIDLETGEATYAGTLAIDEAAFQIEAIAFSPSGDLYGVRTLGSSDTGLSRLYEFDRDTLQAHLVDPFALDFFPSTGVGLAFDDRGGGFYMTTLGDGTQDGNSDQFLFAIDPATAALQQLGPYNEPFADPNTAPFFVGLALATTPAQDCVDVDTVPWLSVDPPAASLTTTGVAEVTVTADASDLADGIYTANLCLTTNDPQRRHEIVRVRLAVGDVDDVFADGFDSAP